MIYSLKGQLVVSEPGIAVIECAGVGFGCAVSFNTLSCLPELGNEVRLLTYMAVREDALDLYGFYTKQELDCFKLLISVSGVGPKVALSILSDFTADRLAIAIAAGDAKALTKCQGIGNKIAQRIVLELKDKVGGFGASVSNIHQIAAPASSGGAMGEAMAALVALGYSSTQAAMALATCDPSMSVEEIIKKALKTMALPL